MFTKSGIFSGSAAASSAILVLSNGPLGTKGIFDNIQISATMHAFMPLTPFEAVFIGLFLTQIYTLQMLGIFPINLNKLFHGRPTGRRKRECRYKHWKEDEVDEMILKIVFKLDKHECLSRSMCELQKNIILGQFDSPIGIKKVLQRFSRFTPKTTNSTGRANKYRLYYTNAVKLGKLAASTNTHCTNSTDQCELHYNSCPLNSNEILTYIYQMRLDDFLN